MNNDQLLRDTLAELDADGKLSRLKRFTQHGRYSVYAHSLSVAALSLRIAERMPGETDYKSLVRGALLHDYFLYDWHVKDRSRPNHALHHARMALENARRDYDINDIEADIIGHHMFPVVPIPPRTREGWIVCMADKISAARETVMRR